MKRTFPSFPSRSKKSVQRNWMFLEGKKGYFKTTHMSTNLMHFMKYYLEPFPSLFLLDLPNLDHLLSESKRRRRYWPGKTLWIVKVTMFIWQRGIFPSIRVTLLSEDEAKWEYKSVRKSHIQHYVPSQHQYPHEISFSGRMNGVSEDLETTI